MLKAPGSWTADAACARPGMDANLWHSPETRAARDICESCPVASQCLEYALAFPNPGCWVGIYAGLTGAQRRTERRTRAEQARASADLAEAS